jgi:hypothetical protein
MKKIFALLVCMTSSRIFGDLYDSLSLKERADLLTAIEYQKNKLCLLRKNEIKKDIKQGAVFGTCAVIGIFALKNSSNLVRTVVKNCCRR